VETPTLVPAFDRLIAHLVEKATPPEILAFQLSEEERERAIGSLSGRARTAYPSEAAELEQCALSMH
jgi:hypothetical protein